MASNAAVATYTPTATAITTGSVVLITAHTETVEHCSEEKSSPRGPGESKGIGTNLSGAVVRMEGITSKDKGGGHERHGDCREKEGDRGGETRNGRAQTSAASEEAGEEGENLKEEGDEDEDPAKSPQVPKLVGGGVAAFSTDKLMRRIVGIRAPCLSKGGCGTSFSAVLVAFAAEVKVGPLGNVAGARDATGVGAQEIRLLEGRRVRDAGENDEEEEDD